MDALYKVLNGVSSKFMYLKTKKPNFGKKFGEIFYIRICRIIIVKLLAVSLLKNQKEKQSE